MTPEDEADAIYIERNGWRATVLMGRVVVRPAVLPQPLVEPLSDTQREAVVRLLDGLAWQKTVIEKWLADHDLDDVEIKGVIP